MLLRKNELELELGHHHIRCAGAGGFRRTLAASLCTGLRRTLPASLCSVHPVLAMLPKEKEHKRIALPCTKKLGRTRSRVGQTVCERLKESVHRFRISVREVSYLSKKCA
jgi:hypothetical protein